MIKTSPFYGMEWKNIGKYVSCQEKKGDTEMTSSMNVKNFPPLWPDAYKPHPTIGGSLEYVLFYDYLVSQKFPYTYSRLSRTFNFSNLLLFCWAILEEPGIEEKWIFSADASPSKLYARMKNNPKIHFIWALHEGSLSRIGKKWGLNPSQLKVLNPLSSYSRKDYYNCCEFLKMKGI